VNQITRNKERADRMIAFINLLPLVDGPAVGQRFVVDPWLEAWIRDIYEPEFVDGVRVVRTAVLSCARKNAKSYAVAGLLLGHLCGPEAIPNGQVFSCAVDREQAAVIFHMCRKMIEMTPFLNRVLRITKSMKTIDVKVSNIKGRGSVYRALSADSSTKHGLGPSFFVYDEYGEARNDNLWNTMFDGQQAVSSPLAIAISTQTNDPQHPFSQMIDDGLTGQDPTIVCHLFAAPEGCDLMDESAWLAANPALSTWKKRAPIAAAASVAKRLPSKEQSFRRRYLNQRVSQHDALITRADWMACLPGGEFPAPTFEAKDAWDFEEGEEVYVGLDMSLRTDLTAMTIVSATNGDRVKTICFKPRAYLEEHGERDRQPYATWVKQGWMIATPGRMVDPLFVAREIQRIHARNPIKGLAYDRAYAGELLKRMDEIGMIAQEGEGAGLRIVPWGQGFVSMGKAVNAFEQSVLQAELKSDGNPSLTYCVGSAVVEADHTGQRRFSKNKVTQRIDAAVALAMTLGLKNEDRTTTFVNPWENPEFDPYA
jgi:hypothetical protein